MFESQLQSVQFAFGGSIICTTVAILVLMFGPPAVGVFFIVLASATGAIGGWLFADHRGYPPALGLGLGIAFGVMAAVFLLILPEQAKPEDPAKLDRHRARRRRSKNYEIVDDDE